MWTSERLSAYLLGADGGGEDSPRLVAGATGGMRFACGGPKHTLSHLRDPEEVAACEAELEEAEKK